MSAGSRLFNWIHALWYPAILGTMIGALLNQRPPSLEAMCWALVLIAYFAVQYGEGLGQASLYKIGDFIFDVIEILLIVAAFWILGVFSIWGETAPTLMESWRRAILAGAFILPVVARAVRKEILRKDIPKTILSCTASVVIVVGGAEIWPATVVAVLLAIHLVLLFISGARPVPDPA